MYPTGPRLRGVRHCHDWPKGTCRRGDLCKWYHHHNLDPNLPRARLDFSVSNELEEGCQRCLQKGLVCDKQGRLDHAGDPCSECRWFGGERCICTLAKTTSYNDHAWEVMMGRPEANFTLPELQKRSAAVDPIPKHKLVSHWTGKSPHELCHTENLWPPFFRSQPRAYLVPSRSAMKEEDRAWQAMNTKRKREEDEDMAAIKPQAAASTDQQYSSQTFIRPPAEPRLGIVTETTYNWTTNTWTHRYERGSISITEEFPSINAPVATTQLVPASRKNEEDIPPIKKQHFGTP